MNSLKEELLQNSETEININNNQFKSSLQIEAAYLQIGIKKVKVLETKLWISRMKISDDIIPLSTIKK